MDIILGFFLALFFSILLVPVLMKYAARWRLVDLPDARKSHAGAIPRVGGIGIAVAASVPALLWAKHDLPLVGYLAGASIIVIFGVLDDRFDLDYRIKFMGQAVAAIIASASSP
jgi:UDP-GlcNAc:undecaprenyl-phosphate GlcNAc-1-phosphate transferase